MFSNKFIVKTKTMFTVFVLVFGSFYNNFAIAEPNNIQPQTISLEIYKSASCGCCNKWVSHVKENDFQITIHNSNSLSAIKTAKGIEPRYRSCHTSVSNNGFDFEGHIPAKLIKQFLKEKQSDGVIGLSVPAMPVGTPGMEVKGKFQPYKVLALNSDGTYDIYAYVKSYEEQF